MEEKIHQLLDLIKKNGDACPDFEKIRELTPKILLCPKDIDDFLYALPDHAYDVAALEAVLLAVDGDVCRGREGNGLAKAILFHLYHDGEYELLIHDRVIKISAPALKSRERYEAFLESDCPDHYMHVGDEDIVPSVFTPDAHDYMMLYLFGTNFGYDMYDYPTQDMDDTSVKSFERAISYLPVYIDHFEMIPQALDFSKTGFLYKLERAGYSAEQIEQFCRAWVETLEKKNLVCNDTMEFYLFGKFTYGAVTYGAPYGNEEITLTDKKCFINAKAHISAYVAWLDEIYVMKRTPDYENYDPDLVLGNLVRKMRAYDYLDADITDFATIWMQEMLKRNEAFYSLMYLRLFGAHFRGTQVNIDGIKNFDRALALIPDYLGYIFAYEGVDDEYAVKFDPDCELYKLTLKMREQGYGENEINTFVAHWINGVEALQKPCNSPIYIYLFNRFVFKRENFKIDLAQNKKNFERAIAFIPKWVAYLTDMSVQYHDGYCERDVFDLLINMHHGGYEKEQSEAVLSAFLEELDRLIPREARSLAASLPHYAEKEPWLTELLPVFDPYITEEAAKESRRR